MLPVVPGIKTRGWGVVGLLISPRSDTFPRMKDQVIRGTVSAEATHRERLTAFLRDHGIARLAEIRRAGLTAATVSRLERRGFVIRFSRGLYQLADAVPEGHHSLAEAAERVPKGVICLISALAFHGITDQMPRRVWIAIGPKDWKPQIDYPPLRIARFANKFLKEGRGQSAPAAVAGLPLSGRRTNTGPAAAAGPW